MRFLYGLSTIITLCATGYFVINFDIGYFGSKGGSIYNLSDLESVIIVILFIITSFSSALYLNFILSLCFFGHYCSTYLKKRSVAIKPVLYAIILCTLALIFYAREMGIQEILKEIEASKYAGVNVIIHMSALLLYIVAFLFSLYNAKRKNLVIKWAESKSS